MQQESTALAVRYLGYTFGYREWPQRGRRVMGIYLRPSRWLGLRFTKRGVRLAIGPRWLRYHTGAGGDGISTGDGPFTYYKGIHHRSRKPGRVVHHGILVRNGEEFWRCPHDHRRQDTADACAMREARRRAAQ